MKKIYYACFLLSVLFYACLEDKGNDVYSELNDVTIERFNDTTIEQFTRLQIVPVISVREKNFNAENYSYLWHMYAAYGSGNATVADTLSFEKDLDVEINNIPGTYTLVLEVVDKETEIRYLRRDFSYVTVINSYSKGMLALSSVNGEANVTFVNVVGSVIPDAYQKVNGAIAGKNPTGIRYTSTMLSNAEKMIVIMTDDERGGTVVKPSDMSYVMDFAGMFYFLPEKIKPQSFGTHDYTAYEYAINDGIIYTRKVMGETGYPKYGVAIKGEYEYMAPFDFFNAMNPQGAYFYDQGKKRFVYMKVPLQGNSVITMTDMTGEFNPNNVGMTMVWGGLFGSQFARTNGRAVMKDGSGEHYMLSFTMGTGPTFTPGKIHQLSHAGGREACAFTTSQNANFLYYAYENKIVCVSFSTGNKLSEYEVEGGNVDYIECDQQGNVKQMWVGVSDGSGAPNSGSIVVLEMSTDGSLTEVARYSNVCGKVVDFEYKTA